MLYDAGKWLGNFGGLQDQAWRDVVSGLRLQDQAWRDIVSGLRGLENEKSK